MKRETLKEIGKGFINIGNGVIIVTIINGLFNFHTKIGNNPLSIIGGIILTSIAYLVGAILINKGANDE